MLGQHELLLRLAAGGAANVFLARDTEAGDASRLLALKLLQPSLAANEDFLNMFFTEAKIASMLDHPNVVRIAGFGRTDGIHCLAMEYIFGASLADLLKASSRANKPLTVGVLLKIAADVASALHAAHELREEDGSPMSLVHRDVTPQNILIGFNGVTKLTDFGIAKATNRGWETQAGIVKGKFCYMSPEQALGKKVDRRCDIFCTGIVLWEALTGKELFNGRNPMEILEAIRGQKILPPSEVVPGLSPVVDPIVMKALRRSPKQRYPTALAMKEDIDALIARAGVDINAETISKEMGEVFGDVISNRALALRQAIAGKADLEHLARSLGGTPVNEEFLPKASETLDDPDPLGLFGDAAAMFEEEEEEEEDATVALPAAVDLSFGAKAGTASAPEGLHDVMEDDLKELSQIEAEHDEGVVRAVTLEGWSDGGGSGTRDKTDDLLALLSEDDDELPDNFTRRFGGAVPRRASASVPAPVRKKTKKADPKAAKPKTPPEPAPHIAVATPQAVHPNLGGQGLLATYREKDSESVAPPPNMPVPGAIAAAQQSRQALVEGMNQDMSPADVKNIQEQNTGKQNGVRIRPAILIVAAIILIGCGIAAGVIASQMAGG